MSDVRHAGDACGDRACADHRVEQVEALFDNEIRPRLAAHLGGAVVDGIDDHGVVHVTFTGACTSCAYRKTTMLTAIYPRLREVEGVVGVATPGVPISRAEERRIGAMIDRYEKR